MIAAIGMIGHGRIEPRCPKGHLYCDEWACSFPEMRFKNSWGLTNILDDPEDMDDWFKYKPPEMLDEDNFIPQSGTGGDMKPLNKKQKTIVKNKRKAERKRRKKNR